MSTPPQRASIFDHVVTQWKSLTVLVLGSARKAFQSKVTGFSTSPHTLKLHSFSSKGGCTPRSSTGNPLLQVCPGGSRLVDRFSFRTAMSLRNRSSIRAFAAIIFSLYPDTVSGSQIR